MPAEFVLRPTYNDHIFVASALAQGFAGRAVDAPPLVSRLVLDATTAARQPAFAESAASAGVPVVVDPMTWLGQKKVDPDGHWARTAFARHASSPADLDTQLGRRRLIQAAVNFQIQHGATSIVPPYFMAERPSDRWQATTLACLRETATYLRAIDDRRPLLPVVCGRLDKFASRAGLNELRYFSDVAAGLGAQLVAAQLGPVGAGTDDYAKVLNLFRATSALRRAGVGVHIWRQGIYGPALVATGAHGYETGIGFGERTDLAALAARHKPKATVDDDTEDKKGGGRGRPVYLRAAGRSLVPAVFQALASNFSLAGSALCPPTCCPDGITSTLSASREHGLLERRRQLDEFDAMPPSVAWRFRQIGGEARRAAEFTKTLNGALPDALTSIATAGQESLAAVADFMVNSAAA